MTIKDDLIAALKERNEAKVSTLRMVQAAIRNKEIEIKKREAGLSEEELMDVLLKEAKKRKEAIYAYEKGGRNELVEKEKAELGIIEGYLPKQMSEEEIEREVSFVVKEVGAQSVKDMGKVMALLVARLKGKADGGKVSEMVKKVLSG